MISRNLFSTSFNAGNRNYFIDIKKTKAGKKYIKISESKKVGEGDYEKYNVMIFEEDIEKFEKAILKTIKNFRRTEKSYDIEKIREKHKNAYAPWTQEDDDRLELMYCEGKTVRELSHIFGRNSGAIRSRIKKLELRDKYGGR